MIKVTVTGRAGEGKSTVAALVVQALRARGLEVAVLHDEEVERLLDPDEGITFGRNIRGVRAKDQGILVETQQVKR